MTLEKMFGLGLSVPPVAAAELGHVRREQGCLFAAIAVVCAFNVDSRLCFSLETAKWRCSALLCSHRAIEDR